MNRKRTSERITEHYDAKVSYFPSSNTGKDVKYISIVLPENSAFEEYEELKVTLTGWVSSVTTDAFGRKIASNRISSCSIIRSMNVGESIYFDIDRWSVVRSDASRLKREYGAVFEVHKVVDERTQDESVCVTRIA